MPRNLMQLICLIFLCLFSIDTALAQSWAERVAAVKRKRAQAQQQEMTAKHPTVMMRQVLPAVDFNQTSLKNAIDWWRESVGVSMLVDWNALELEGVDSGKPITLSLRNAPANIVLDIILELASEEFKLYHYETQWYVQILTRQQILKKTQTRMYDVRDLLVQIPNYRNRAPKMGLSEALSNTSSVGGSSNNSAGGSSTSLFEDSDTDTSDTKRPTQKDRALELMDLIRNTIETDIWIANGGYYSSITFFNGMLVVKAPEFVHRQIGSPTISLLGPNRSGGKLDQASRYQTGKAVKATGSSYSSNGKSNVSAIQDKAASTNVSAVGVSK
ncbi:MAG TPA: hypothetical protein DCM28_03450 [Phycisphaerales bacterium]|nr:hypothetical protein [Phycisphaerales bacterium]HCD32538.1 hypothetical protein [Phycisphaerales bacterium]|tara:strand:- start:776 stop:1762 length:987 start_codon:yes stop_codon:yes gene_type:complete